MCNKKLLRTKELLLVIVMFIFNITYGEKDTILIYDATKSGSWRIEFYPLPDIDTMEVSEYSYGNVGGLNSFINIDTSTVTSTQPGEFSELVPASSFFNVNNYPVSPNVNFFYYNIG